MEFIGSPEKWAWLASLAYQPLEQSISNAKIENNTLHSACVMLTRREKGAAAIKTPSLNSLVAVRSIKRLGVDPRCGYRLICWVWISTQSARRYKALVVWMGGLFPLYSNSSRIQRGLIEFPGFDLNTRWRCFHTYKSLITWRAMVSLIMDQVCYYRWAIKVL